MDTNTTSTPPRRDVRVPYLALKHATGSDDQPVFYTVSDKKATIDVDAAGELENGNCWATPQGWVLVRKAASSSTYLLDPHDRSTRIQLPHLPEDGLSSFFSCLLSDYPDPVASERCLVLLIEPDDPVIWYCHVGDDAWVRYEYDIGALELPDESEGYSEKLVMCSVASCDGKFYFNGGFDELSVLELDGPAPVFSSIAIRNAIEEPFGCQKEFLVESGQELFMVSLLAATDLNALYRVQVHRMDFSA
ncbi:hypothetical protein HU200_035628 [Digitaria exilis]|uniref:KIB1-4 beta-propeller domain-containing protein n=1 Tax=Digitaria exilis TaxID=1010633 RepID=A0A835BIF8_9POAL|nr:hypothetical protein HU200_035628 [Digitaria exilis]